MTIFHRKQQQRRSLRPPERSFRSYAWAYHQAALVLVQHSDIDERGSRFPIVFLYRQTIELEIKGLLIEFGAEKLGLTRDKILKRDHSLSEQLPDLYALAATVRYAFSEQFDELLRGFEKHDPKSMHFRYPMNKSGDRLLASDFEFDLPAFVEGAEAILEELGFCAEELDSEAIDKIIAEIDPVARAHSTRAPSE